MATDSASPDTAEFTYQMQLVIYKFIGLVSSSPQTSPSDDEASSHKMLNNSGDAVYPGRRRENDEDMFNELRNAVAARQRQKDEAARRTQMSARVFKELKARVEERDKVLHGDVTLPPVTIIRKRNALKAVMSPPIGLLTAHANVSGGRSLNEAPLFSSTPSATASSVMASPFHQISDCLDAVEYSEQLSRSISSVSDVSSAYIDIYQFDDIKPLVSAGVLPPVAEPLLLEVQDGIEKLKASHSGLEDEFDCGHIDAVSTSQANEDVSEDIKQARISEAAELLRCVGDQIQAEFGDEIDSIVRRINWSLPRSEMLGEIRRLSEELIQRATNGWIRVALAMLLCRTMIYSMLSSGLKGISDIVKFTAQIIEDYAAQYIIDHGGWNSILELSESTVCVIDDELLSSLCEQLNDVAANNNDADEIDSVTLLKVANQSAAVQNNGGEHYNGASEGSDTAEGRSRSASDVERHSWQQFSWWNSTSVRTTSLLGIAFLATLGFFLIRRFRRS